MRSAVAEHARVRVDSECGDRDSDKTFCARFWSE